MITISIQSHNFAKRLNLMLSSLVQQWNAPPITVSVHCLRDSADREIADWFDRKGLLDIALNLYPDQSDFQYRGITRNAELSRCKTDWLLFADADMVYHSEYFNRLAVLLKKEYSDYSGVLTAGRFSNEPIEVTNQWVDLLTLAAPVMVPLVFSQACDALSNNFVKKANMGAGYFQLINMHHCGHGGYYVKPSDNRDHSWDKYQKANSDKQFRRRIKNKQKLPKWFSQNQIHLNHYRDSITKTHLEDAR